MFQVGESGPGLRDESAVTQNRDSIKNLIKAVSGVKGGDPRG